MAIDEDYLTVAEAADLLRVHPSTIRRWIRQGDVPAVRVGHRRVTVRRADLGTMVAPVVAPPTPEDQAAYWEAVRRRRMTPEEQRRTLDAVERAKRRHAALLERRGGEPYSPSWELLNELRDERTRELA